jgi:hypothetical protein
MPDATQFRLTLRSHPKTICIDFRKPPVLGFELRLLAADTGPETPAILAKQTVRA